MYIVLAVVIIGFGFINKSFGVGDDARTTYGDDWREVLQAENEELLVKEAEVDEKLAQYDEKYGDANVDEHGFDEKRFDIEVSAPDLSTIDQNNMYLEKDIKPSGYGAWQFVANSAGLLSVVSLLTIIVAAGIVAYEFRAGTIKLLLIRPISRSTILLSKYLAVLIFTLVTLLLTLLLAWIVGFILFGLEGSNPHMFIFDVMNFDPGSTGKLVSTYHQVITGYGYGLVELVMMTTLAFMISSIFRNSSLAIAIALFLMFVGGTITGIFLEFKPAIAKYILFTNTYLKQYADDYVMVEGMTLGFSITVLVVYYVIFMALSWIFFVKRDVA